MPLRLILVGIATILAGIGIQLLDARLGLMAWIGLSGTAFGLLAKAGGAVALAGLLGFALQQRRPEAQVVEMPSPGPAPQRNAMAAATRRLPRPDKADPGRRSVRNLP